MFKSEVARKSIATQRLARAKKIETQRSDQARIERKKICAPWSNLKREEFVPASSPSIEALSEDEILLKRVIMNGLSSHSKISTSALPGIVKRKQLETLSYYAYQFQQNEDFREPFDLKTSNPGSKKLFNASPDDIVANLFEHSQTANLVFLTGSIGTGKSTLATIVQAMLYRKIHTKEPELRELIIPVDFESLRAIIDINEQHVSVTALTDFVFAAIKKEVGKVKEATLELHLSKSRKKYIFIFDNLDVAFTEFCRHFVVGEQNVQGIIGETKFLICLQGLVDVFRSIHRKSGIVGPAVLFCLRDDTMHLLERATESIGQPSLGEQYSRYFMKDNPDNSQHFSSIVGKRSTMVEQMLGAGDVSDSTKQLAGLFWPSSQKNARHFRRYVNLSVQGLRTAIHSLARYISITDAPLNRIYSVFNDPHRVDILCYINGQEFYSQNNSNITNIFLVNSEYRNSSETAAVPVKLKIGELFHHHTLWLKYLIFAHIDCRSKSGTKEALLEEIIDIFGNLAGFERDLVALIVYSLTEVEHGRLVRPKSSQSARLLTLTSRGREFSRNNMEVAWSFSYLATVVEDEWLELPRSLAEELVIFGANGLWDDASYSQYLTHKVKIVQKFLLCLEISLSFERERRPALFVQLEENSDISKHIPDFKLVHKSVFSQVEEMARYLDTVEQEKIREVIKTISNKRYIFDQIEILTKELSPLYDYSEFKGVEH